MESSRVIVYFDGVCGLCNRFVDFLLKYDKSKSLKFAPLQKSKFQNEDLSTVILSIDDQLYTKSEAALRAISFMGGIWKLALLFLVIPKLIRDPVYDFIAKNRYQWFGKSETCRLPTPEERSRFINE